MPTPTPAPAASAAPEIRPLADMPEIQQAAPPPPAPVAAAPTAKPPAPPAPAAAPAPAPVAAAEPRPAPIAAPAPRVETPPRPEPAPAPRQQTAAVAPVPQPPAMPSGESQALRIGFTGENAALPEPAKGDLKSVIDNLTKNPAMRVQVKAYASGNAEAASKARRISLSRALAVRAYLIEQGIGSTRIDVRALGNNAEGGPGDRVDLVLVAR
jgi:outer membrane protein OmpA-like peptidoglycan-associated protein